MLNFYKNALALIALVGAFTVLIFYVGTPLSQLDTPLFPERDERYPWRQAIEPQQVVDKTRLDVKSNAGSIEYDFFLDPEKPFPYTHYSLYFIDAHQPYKLVDLRTYSAISFSIRCDPKNVMLLVLFSYDDKVTDINKAVTRRVSSTAFSCNQQTTSISIPFDKLITPHWWLGRYGYEYSDSGYNQDKVMGIAWVNSLQSPINTLSNIHITDVRLTGTNSHIASMLIALCLLLWVALAIGLFRYYVRSLVANLRNKVRQDQPILAYTQLSIEPQRDKEKSAIMRFMATEYANPDINLDTLISTLGMNRTKINDVLKAELGLTFTGYLNKLRLTEAARLLSDMQQLSISEIAYKVGYNNASYFNKLFKEEYGCPPKTFRTLCANQEKPPIGEAN